MNPLLSPLAHKMLLCSHTPACTLVTAVTWLLAEDASPQPRPLQPQQSLPAVVSKALWLGQALWGVSVGAQAHLRCPSHPEGGCAPLPSQRKWPCSPEVALHCLLLGIFGEPCDKQGPPHLPEKHTSEKSHKGKPVYRRTPCSSCSPCFPPQGKQWGLRGLEAHLPSLTEP